MRLFLNNLAFNYLSLHWSKKRTFVSETKQILWKLIYNWCNVSSVKVIPKGNSISCKQSKKEMK